MLSPSDEYFLDISAGDPVELPGTPYNHHIDDEDKFSIETISAIEYASFYDYRSEQKSANLLNLDHDKGALDIRVYMDGPIPTETDTLTIKVSCTDPNLTDVILKKAVLPPEYVFDNIPETIQPGDSVKLEIFYPIDDDLEPFPEDQKYIIKIYKGAEYGRIYSEAEGEDGEEFTEVPGPFYFIANDSIPDSSAIVRIRMEDVYELLPCSIKPDSGITIKDNNISSGIKSSGNIKLKIPNVKNAAAGAAAEDPDYWPWFGAVEIKIGEIDSLDHFLVMAEPDTIEPGQSTKLTVIAQSKENKEVPFPQDSLLTLIADSAGFGKFIKAPGDTVDTPVDSLRYGDLRQGKIQYYANKDLEITNDSMKVNITAQKMDEPAIRGTVELVITNEKPILKIIDPDTIGVDTLWISSTPQMPRDTCKAVLLNYDNGEVKYKWKYKVKYSLPRDGDNTNHTRDDSYIFRDSTTANNSDTTEYIVNFISNNNTIFIGGKVKLFVEAVTPDSTYTDSLINQIVILGENPSPQLARDGAEELQEDIAFQMSVIMYMESKFDQFYDARWDALCSDRNIENHTLWGPPNGYGICQIEFVYLGDELFSLAEQRSLLWNWRSNIRPGIRKYNQCIGSSNRYIGQVRVGTDIYSIPNNPNYPEHHHIIENYSINQETGEPEDYHGGFVNATNFTAEQLQIERYQLYQGGHYYIWQLTDPANVNGSGSWVPRLDPNSQFMSGDNRYRIHQQVLNADNGIGNYPVGWNDDE